MPISPIYPEERFCGTCTSTWPPSIATGRQEFAIQKDTAGAVHSISEIATVVERVSDISSTIVRTVEDQSSTTRNIGKNGSQAAVGSSAIAGKIADVAKVAQDAQQAAIQTQSAAQAVTRMASELRCATWSAASRSIKSCWRC